MNKDRERSGGELHKLRVHKVCLELNSMAAAFHSGHYDKEYMFERYCTDCRRRTSTKLVCPECGRTADRVTAWAAVSSADFTTSSMLWKTKREGHVHISDMDMSHAVNTIRLLIRGAVDLQSLLIECLNHITCQPISDSIRASFYSQFLAEALRSDWTQYLGMKFWMIFGDLQRRGSDCTWESCVRYYESYLDDTHPSAPMRSFGRATFGTAGY